MKNLHQIKPAIDDKILAQLAYWQGLGYKTRIIGTVVEYKGPNWGFWDNYATPGDLIYMLSAWKRKKKPMPIINFK